MVETKNKLTTVEVVEYMCKTFSPLVTSDSVLSWDGNVKNCFKFEDTYYRISSFTPTFEEAKSGGSITVTSPSSEYAGTFTFTSDDVIKEDDVNIYSIVPSNGNAFSTIIVCLEDVYFNNTSSFMKKGIYVTGDLDIGYPSAIVFDGFSFASKVIAEEYIPNEVVTYDAFNLLESDNIFVGDDVVGSTVPINADTVGGYSAMELMTAGTIDIDSGLSEVSTNPVQNKIITNAINELTEEIGDISTALNSILGV